MNAPTPIVNGLEGSYYSIFPWVTDPALDIAAAGNVEYEKPYSLFVPAGETRPIHITNCFSQIQGPQTPNLGVVAVVIESPSGSGVWKQILAESLDDVNGGRDQQRFNPGVIMNPGDGFCIQVVWNAQPARESVWQGPTATTRRRVGIGIEYTIG